LEVPKVPPDFELLAATRAVVRSHGGNQAAAAKELGVTRVFMSRFLKGGRAIQASKDQLRDGLRKQAAGHPDLGSAASFGSETIPENEIVKQALRYLLHAVEAYEQQGGYRGH
jgi:predicted transcriptional regulator